MEVVTTGLSNAGTVLTTVLGIVTASPVLFLPIGLGILAMGVGLVKRLVH